MTRDQQIRKALKLLAPPTAEREECRHEIRLALDRVENFTAFARSSRASRSKKRADCRVTTLRSDGCSTPSILSIRRSSLGSISPQAFTTRTTIEAEIAKAESLLAQPSAPPRRDGSRNKAAVAAAYDLLTWRGHTATVTRGGIWEKLAKILADDLTVDLFDHLRKFKQSPGMIVEKVRVESERILYRSGRPQPDIKSSRKKSDK